MGIADGITRLLCAGCLIAPLPRTTTCGPQTVVTERSLMATACSAPVRTGCNAAAALAAPSRTASVSPGTPTTLLGEVSNPSKLIFYELAGCANTIRVTKTRTDIILNAQ